MTPRHLCEPVQLPNRRRARVAHQVGRKEPREMVGNARVEPCKPTRHSVDLRLVIGKPRHHERGHLEVAARLRGKHLDRMLHGAQVAAERAVPFIGEAFQVDVGGIDERGDVGDDAMGRHAVRDEHVAVKPLSMACLIRPM